ncbi:L-lactate permease [Intrasporangium calvum]|uniref:L-lactate permease n=1 Tax=Intrasporangium calvum TaxID=53358 RepID=A0ABT5GD63_9MICO|nr:L-lactate permease [Intrasporangium calvum]MDC5696169.1 L-lactate permease [Intrasporangium calvum]
MFATVPIGTALVTDDFVQSLAPVGGSLALSALVGLLPLVVVFLLLGVVKTQAWVAAIAGLGTALLVAVIGYGMPASLALLSATQGGVFGVFPIMWIVLTALWLYQLTVTSGRFEDLRATFNMVSEDPRIQAVLIAFCFGGLLEALAGFGAPVAITATMLIALGVAPLRAAGTVLLANTAPVAFGAIAIPITTAATLTGIPESTIGAIVGRQAPLLAVVVPLLLLLVVDGKRGLREVWPAALVTGLSFAVAQFLTSNYLSVALTDIVASLAGLGATVLFLRVWTPVGAREAHERLEAGRRHEHAEAVAAGRVPAGSTSAPTSTSSVATSVLDEDRTAPLPAARIWMGLFPYLLVIAVFSVSKLVPAVKSFLAGTDQKIAWPGLDGHVLSASGKPISSTSYTFQWLSSPGTMLLIAGVIVAIVYGISARQAVRDFTDTVFKLRWAILTVASVLALAYVMNFSGQTISIGTWIAGTGAFFAFLSPVLGWIGTAVTGSDTSANALFAKLQATAGSHAGINESLLVSANTTGGVVGKMISPQNLTIAASSAGLDGQESAILRRVLPWSVGLLLFLCVLVFLQSTPILGWMLP